MANELLCEESFGEIQCGRSNNNDYSPKKYHMDGQISGKYPAATFPYIEDEVRTPVRAVKDPRLLKDERVLKNLLKLEKICVPVSEDYLRSGIQPDLNPSYRKIVTDWMLQVCHECGCSPDVFMLAVNFMDRFLAVMPRQQKNRLQLIGTVCLLISSKFKETSPLPGERLIHYTDNSVTPDEIRNWELVILEKIKWEVSVATPMDFTDHILLRLGIPQMTSEIQLDELKLRIETVLALAVTEYTFSYLNPSLLAASAIQLVLSRFLKFDQFTKLPNHQIDERICDAIGAIPGDVELCVTQLEKVVPNYLLRFDIDNSSKSGSPIANSHSDYGSADYASSISSSISSSPTTLHQPAQTASHASSTANTLVESPSNLPNEMNDSCILVS